MSDENNNISRFYFDATTAQTYRSSILTSQSPLSAKMGGSIQGTSVFSNISASTGHAAFTNISTIAGHTGTPLTYLGATTYKNYSGATASFFQPNGLTTDGTNIYVADYRNNMIRKVNIASGAVTTLAGSPAGIAGITDSTSNDISGTTATFNLPSAITTDGTYLYVADTGNNAIRMVDPSNGSVHWVAGSTSGAAGSNDALIGTDARFNQPYGITTDGTNLYVADTGNNTIRKIVISTGAVVTLAGAAAAPGSDDSGADNTGASARFNLPTRLTTDGSNLYVTDFNNKTIRKVVIATGAVTTIAGIRGTVGVLDGPGLTATFNQPNGITTDGTNLYVTDTYSNTIRIISITTADVTTLKIPTFNTTTQEIEMDPPPLFHPIGITTDGKSLFVANTYTIQTDDKNNTNYTFYNSIVRIQ